MLTRISTKYTDLEKCQYCVAIIKQHKFTKKKKKSFHAASLNRKEATRKHTQESDLRPSKKKREYGR